MERLRESGEQRKRTALRNSDGWVKITLGDIAFGLEIAIRANDRVLNPRAGGSEVCAAREMDGRMGDGLLDRKRGVLGKSVSVRVALGGRGIIQKKLTETKLL